VAQESKAIDITSLLIFRREKKREELFGEEGDRRKERHSRKEGGKDTA